MYTSPMMNNYSDELRLNMKCVIQKLLRALMTQIIFYHLTLMSIEPYNALHLKETGIS